MWPVTWWPCLLAKEPSVALPYSLEGSSLLEKHPNPTLKSKITTTQNPLIYNHMVSSLQVKKDIIQWKSLGKFKSLGKYKCDMKSIDILGSMFLESFLHHLIMIKLSRGIFCPYWPRKYTGQILLIKILKFLGREDPKKLSWIHRALSRRERSQCNAATAEQ